jgi:hypothetical protein
MLVDKTGRVKWPLGAGAVRVDTGKSLVRSEARHGCGREEGSWKNQPSTPLLERIGNRRANRPPREVEILPTAPLPAGPRLAGSTCQRKVREGRQNSPVSRSHGRTLCLPPVRVRCGFLGLGPGVQARHRRARTASRCTEAVHSQYHV